MSFRDNLSIVDKIALQDDFAIQESIPVRIDLKKRARQSSIAECLDLFNLGITYYAWVTSHLAPQNIEFF